MRSEVNAVEGIEVKYLLFQFVICSQNLLFLSQVKDIMVGTEAQKLRQMLQITYPLDNGIIRNWTDME